MPRGFIVERREVNGTYRSLHKGLTKPHVRTFLTTGVYQEECMSIVWWRNYPMEPTPSPLELCRPTQPFFALEPVVKTITGMVVNRDKEVIAGAEVFARRIDGRGWNSTLYRRRW